LRRALVAGALPSRPASHAAALGRWMRGELRVFVESHLLADDPEHLFAPVGLTALWRGFLARRVGWEAVWSLAVLRGWIAARREELRRTGDARSVLGSRDAA
jgi:hypothetical protein